MATKPNVFYISGEIKGLNQQVLHQTD